MYDVPASFGLCIIYEVAVSMQLIDNIVSWYDFTKNQVSKILRYSIRRVCGNDHPLLVLIDEILKAQNFKINNDYYDIDIKQEDYQIWMVIQM